jgi:hypothetical protein
MAESSIRYNGWANYFEVGEFAVFWLIMETVLDEENLKLGPLSLDGRIQELISKDQLVEDWYHSTRLDEVIGGDQQRFYELLAKAVTFTSESLCRMDDFWSLLKQPRQAQAVGPMFYGEKPRMDSLVGLITRFSLPALLKDYDHPIMTALGWFKDPS